MDDGRWLEPRYEDVYHGKADGAGGPAWVLPLLHTVHGPYAEVRAGSPDGEVVRRVTAQHVRHAEAIVQDLRDAMMRDGLGAIVGEVEPVGGRGWLDLHAAYAENLQSVAAIDGIDPTLTCARIWLTPGRHVVQVAFVVMAVTDFAVPMKIRKPQWATEEIDIRMGEQVVRFHSLFRSRLIERVPWLHRSCGLRRNDRLPDEP